MVTLLVLEMQAKEPNEMKVFLREHTWMWTGNPLGINQSNANSFALIVLKIQAKEPTYVLFWESTLGCEQ